jgi:transcription elongation GreA/GreB family factor
MSRAFVKDSEDTGALPDRPVSTHANLVTPEGLARLDAEVARWRDAYGEAQRGEDRDSLATSGRELRYWTARRASAQLVEPDPDAEVVRFGARVAIRRGDGRRQVFRIVGEDEADPAAGTLSHVSPLARALLGREEGDVVSVGGDEVEIERIEA